MRWLRTDRQYNSLQSIKGHGVSPIKISSRLHFLYKSALLVCFEMASCVKAVCAV